MTAGELVSFLIVLAFVGLFALGLWDEERREAEYCEWLSREHPGDKYGGNPMWRL